MSKLVFLALIFLNITLLAEKTTWGTIYNPTQTELREESSINLQEQAFVEAYQEKDYKQAYQLAVHPIQRTYALLELAKQSKHHRKNFLNQAYLALSQSDGFNHLTKGDQIAYEALNKMWQKEFDK